MHLTTKILIYMVAALIVGITLNFPWLGSPEQLSWLGNAAQSQFGDITHYRLIDFSFVKNTVVSGFFAVGGTVFIQMLKMLVVPVVFCSLISGIVAMDDIKALGRTGSKAFCLYLLTTALAISLAIFVAFSFDIGSSTQLETQAQQANFTAKEAPDLAQVIINIASDNMLSSMASGNMLQIIFVCLFLGIAIANSGESGKSVGIGINKFNDVMMTLVNMVMSFAPYGVFCLVAKIFAEQGFSVIAAMASYFGTVSLVLMLHLFGTISLLLAFSRINPFIFLKKIRSVQLFAFSTASSNATIPVNLQAVKERLGVSNATASFTIPFGATINMDGTAIMQGVATIFIANIYGIELATPEYLTVILMAVLASIGTAGVPGVGLVMLTMVFSQVGLPVEGIALILGVDRLLDMMRTAVNVSGDAAVSCIVAKSEKCLDKDIFNDPKAGKKAAEWHEHQDQAPSTT